MAFFQSPPRLDNQFRSDRVLRDFLTRTIPEDVRRAIEPSLDHMGALAAGPLLELAARHRRDEPAHVPYDPWGNRIDEVTVNPAWKEYARVAATEGLIATAYERATGPHARLHQMALVYLFDRSTQVYTCPLAMTDGCARTLEMLAPPELRDEVLPRLTSRDPDRAWTSGQWMTERTGGSDVGLAETVAREEQGQWRLYGHKWFTSAVTSDVALTLARPEGNPPGGKGLALFYVRLRDDAGRLQGIGVDRLKDKLGTRNLPTAELTLSGAPAVPVAGLHEGVRNMRFMLNLTRTWNAVCSVAGMRRGLALARDYATRRVAFGAALSDKPLHLDTLASMAAEYEAAFALAFHVVSLLGRDEVGDCTDDEQRLLRVLHPLAKLVTGKQVVEVTGEAAEAFGGAGYIEDTGVPELVRDSHVLPIWEGTTNVLALETFRALQRTEGLTLLVEEIRRRVAAAGDASLRGPGQVALQAAEHAATWIAAHAANPPAFEAGARRAAMTLGRALALALLCEQAGWAIATRGDHRSAHAAARFAAHGVDQVRDDSDLAGTRSLALDLE